jgi:hypothetical protein
MLTNMSANSGIGKPILPLKQAVRQEPVDPSLREHSFCLEKREDWL